VTEPRAPSAALRQRRPQPHRPPERRADRLAGGRKRRRLPDRLDRRAGATPIYLSGLPAERDEEEPGLYGIATGNGGGERLEAADIAIPSEDGVITGPTGALINRAAQEDYGSLGLVVECSPQFPDPEAASVLLEDGIAPVTGLEIDVTELVDRAEEIRAKREQLAQQMQAIGQDESSQAQPLRMYQ